MSTHAHGHFKSDPLLVCPYNPAHTILQSRFATHLVKCKPTSSLRKCTCPYNATHLLEEAEMGQHMESCPDRRVLDTFKYKVGSSSKKIDILPVENRDIPCEESWDDVDYPTYNPETKLQEDGKLLVNLKNAPPSERKKYREERRQLYTTDRVKSEVGEAGVDGEPMPVCSSYSEPFQPDQVYEECGVEEFEHHPKKAGPGKRSPDYSLSGVGRGSRIKKSCSKN